MQSLFLDKQILSFVRTLLVVEERQILRFFSNWSEEEVRKQLKVMLMESSLFKQNDGRISCKRKLRHGSRSYEDLIRAVDVMCELRSDDIRWFFLDDYPTEITFITEDNIAYDVTVFDESSWVAKYALVMRLRTKCLPDGEDDPFQHIAVVPNMEILRKVEPLGWAMYAMVDGQGKVALMKTE